ncbi:MAG: ATPase domain-containing protein [Candidatus Micrarchaeota archaeon]
MSFKVDRIPIGIPGIDVLIEGGFEKNSANLVRGGTGTGKTIFSLQFIHNGLKKKENGVYLSFSETKQEIYTHGRMFGWDLERYEKNNNFGFLRYAPHEVAKVVEGGGGTIRDFIESIDAKRLVIDSLTAYAMPFQSDYASNQSILELFEMLRDLDCTTIVTSETNANISLADDERLGYLTDAIINLYYVRKDSTRKRSLEVVKMRNTHHSEKLHNYQITKNGISIKR